MRISDWSSDVCSSDLDAEIALSPGFRWGTSLLPGQAITVEGLHNACAMTYPQAYRSPMSGEFIKTILEDVADNLFNPDRSEEHTSELQSLMRISYAVFCLTKKTHTNTLPPATQH